jgi:hypothetical protein
VPFARRGPRSDEYIAVMRKLWAEDGASFEGQFVKFHEVSSNPKPVRGTVPIVIGGHSEAAARRAGRLGERLLPLDWLAGRHGAVVRRGASHRRGGRPRPQGDRDHGRLPDLLPGSAADPRAAIEARARQGVGRIILPVWRYLPTSRTG